MSRTDTSGTATVAVTSLCVGLGATIGFLPGFLATALIDDLGISRGQVGLIVSVYFGCTGVGSIMGGRVTELLGARLVVVLDMAIVAGAGTFAVVVGTYWALLLSAVVAGSGYALVNAGTNLAIARATPDHRRTMAMSIKTAGVPMAAVVTAGLGPWSAERWSWKVMMLATAGLALLALVAALFVLHDDRPEPVQRRVKTELPPGFAWFAVASFFVIAGTQPLYSWTVAYMEESLETSRSVAGGVTSVALAVGVVAMVVNAAWSDRIGAARRVPQMMGLLVLSGLSTVLLMVGASIGVAVAVVGAVGGIATQLAAVATMHAVVVDRAPHAVARATGVTMTGYYLGALVSPVGFGALVDATGTFGYAWLAATLLLLLALPAWVVAGRIPIVNT